MLFVCAWATEKGFIPTSIVQHPLVYVLSLGVYASSWAYYGNIGVAYDNGYIFLAFYFGLSGAFLLAPLLLSPILTIIHKNQLGSLADLFAFRFRSPTAGTLSTLLLLIAVMPLLALQIQAVADSIHLISRESSPEILAIGFCTLIILFAIFFGSRHITSRDHHQGLVFAIAIESLLKLVVMLVLGGVALAQVFGGLDGLNQWLIANSSNISGISSNVENGPWRTTLLMFFASAIVMPHMFHMTFIENRDKKALNIASWGLPLFLLLLSISTPLILWSGTKLNVDLPPEYFPLAIGQALNIPWLTIIVYLGGLSSASGLIIVTTLALSSMMLNHIVLPIYQKNDQTNFHINIYRRLIWLKRLLIIAVIVAAYGFYLSLNDERNLYSLSIIAYVGALQLLPGALCCLYWEKANHKGFISGLIAGTLVWFVCLMLPLALDQTAILSLTIPSDAMILENWHLVAMASLILNGGIFYTVSSATKMSEAEIRVAQACMVQHIKLDTRSVPKAGSAMEFQAMLSAPLGKRAAHKEVSKALTELDIKADEKRPQALARLRDKIETNLSGLMGPTIAHEIVGNFLPLNSDKNYITQDIHFIETRLEAYHFQLSGLAAELDSLRRYHRDTLNSIPLGVCAIGNKEIMLWNHAIAQLTGLDASQALGTPVTQLPDPWATLVNDFLESDADYQTKYRLEVDGQLRYFNLHKANIDAVIPSLTGNQVMLLEDMTENQMLEEQLTHSERLASIGQLAAGIAHEIGNPITGIDCLAQE
ncbi:ATPase, partial [Endozoicomonas sp.]|nr:ATPase [Endozoicomonas sp.]